jgi:hypothetical protein
MEAVGPTRRPITQVTTSVHPGLSSKYSLSFQLVGHSSLMAFPDNSRGDRPVYSTRSTAVRVATDYRALENSLQGMKMMEQTWFDADDAYNA